MSRHWLPEAFETANEIHKQEMHLQRPKRRAGTVKMPPQWREETLIILTAADTVCGADSNNTARLLARSKSTQKGIHLTPDGSMPFNLCYNCKTELAKSPAVGVGVVAHVRNSSPFLIRWSCFGSFRTHPIVRSP